jgi:4a-hydroxytetrahydrobiopterin dehydratase
MDWKIEGKSLTKEFVLANFADAIKFVDSIVPLAEEMNHHPDVLIHSYKKVKIMLFTHSKDKITENDYTLAKKIDAL